jgi:hypothetical protein
VQVLQALSLSGDLVPKYKSIIDASPEVIARYYRRKYSRKCWPHVEAATRRYSRITLTLRERKKNKVLRTTLETFKREAARANAKGNECIQVLMNMGLFYLLAESDIQAVKIDALTHPDEWKRKLSLRIILLTIYEWDMGKVAGKDLKGLLYRSSVPDDLQSELFESLRSLKKAQRRAAKTLHEPRNSVIAHRDSDALSQVNIIESLNAVDVFGAAEEFYASSDRFMHALAKVLSQAGSFQGLVAFLLNQKKA